MTSSSYCIILPYDLSGREFFEVLMKVVAVHDYGEYTMPKYICFDMLMLWKYTRIVRLVRLVATGQP